MTTNYSRFKTPFYEIFVGDSSGKNMKKLPLQIARLVEKVEITETSCCTDFLQINLTINEGSREPYKQSRNVGANPDIYKAGGLSLTNASGMVADLKLDSGGITSLGSVVGSVTTFISSPGAAADVGKITEAFPSLAKPNIPPNPFFEEITIPDPTGDVRYLFHQRNQIMIKWGYKEAIEQARCVRGYITIISSDFPESGTPKTTIAAMGPAGVADQITPKKGKVFSTKVPKGVSESGSPMFSDKDLEFKPFIQKLCTEMKIDCIVSDNIKGAIPDAGKSRVWPAGMSLHGFFVELAKAYDCQYQFYINCETGVDTVVFLSKSDWTKYPNVDDKDLLTYRATGSIIKSVGLKSDFGLPTGTMLKNISEDGQEQAVGTESVSLALFGKSGQQDNTPVGTNPVGLAVGAAAVVGGVTGNVHSTASNSTSNIKNSAQSITNTSINKFVTIEFSSLGFPLLSPGMHKFGGIGERFSTMYNIISVTHTLDSNGYNCKGSGMTHMNTAGGSIPADKVVMESDSSVDVKLFTKKTAANTPVGKYKKLTGVEK